MNPEIIIVDYDSCRFCHHCSASVQSKTSGSSLVFQKLAKKLGKLKGSGGGGGGGGEVGSSSTAGSGEKADKSVFRMSKKKSRSQSVGTMDGVDG